MIHFFCDVKRRDKTSEIRPDLHAAGRLGVAHLAEPVLLGAASVMWPAGHVGAARCGTDGTASYELYWVL